MAFQTVNEIMQLLYQKLCCEANLSVLILIKDGSYLTTGIKTDCKFSSQRSMFTCSLTFFLCNFQGQFSSKSFWFRTTNYFLRGCLKNKWIIQIFSYSAHRGTWTFWNILKRWKLSVPGNASMRAWAAFFRVRSFSISVLGFSESSRSFPPGHIASFNLSRYSAHLSSLVMSSISLWTCLPIEHKQKYWKLIGLFYSSVLTKRELDNNLWPACLSEEEYNAANTHIYIVVAKG